MAADWVRPTDGQVRVNERVASRRPRTPRKDLGGRDVARLFGPGDTADKRITDDGDRWCWQLKSISALGMHVEPSFTEYMSFEEGRRITFEHRPPSGNAERAGAKGTYTLADRPDGGTHLAVDITLHVELPLPAVSRRLVERVMESMMARTGERFAGNLYARLGIVGGSVPTRVRAGR